VWVRFIGFGLAMLIAAPAQAEWVLVAEGATGSAWYMDAARVTKKSGRVQAWAKIDYSRDASVKYRSEMRLFSFICDDRKFKVLSYTEYDSYGKVVGTNSVNDTLSAYDYQPVTPESIVEGLLLAACAL
jgi:hypothetical protein